MRQVRETSRKPDEMYSLLERLSPGTRKLVRLNPYPLHPSPWCLALVSSVPPMPAPLLYQRPPAHLQRQFVLCVDIACGSWIVACPLSGSPQEIFARQHNCQPGWVGLGNQLHNTNIKDPDLFARFNEVYGEGKRDPLKG